MRELDRGEDFIVRHEGEPIGALRPVRKRHFVPAAELQEALHGVGPIDPDCFREDVDAIVDQDSTPRPWHQD